MKVDTCGCCDLPAGTPIVAFNRPGLTAIVFRVGTYSSFRLSMLQRISRLQALSTLHTRSDDDYAVTLLDMWATVADVLTFYQERIANEAYLRTARLRDSILRMARLLDYQLRPGVSATTLLAFTLEKNASLKIPVGLRVQSVPSDGEKPEIYETLEPILADAKLNSMRILPTPEGFNPLAKGSTSGILAPGPEGLAAATALSPGNHFVLFQPTGGQIEELTVRELRAEDGRMSLVWSGTLQHSNWNFSSPAYAVNRSFRIFGYNAPTQYIEAFEPSPGDFTWTRRTFTDASYAYTPAGNVLELDAKYEGIAVGTRLLISQPSVSNDLATVTAVSQGQATFLAPSATTSPVQDTVTRVTLSLAPSIADRRRAVIYEITSPRIRFWGYRYPDKLGGPTVYIPAVRIDPETVEIGRAIENNAFVPGVVLPLKNIGVGRSVILRDSAEPPTTATVHDVAAIGLDADIATTPYDLTTALQLRLNREEARQLTGLRSAALPPAIALTNPKPEVSAAIGSLVARTIQLGTAPANIAAAAAALQAGLAASLPLTPEFTQCRVTQVENSLTVLTGARGLPITFGPTSADPTTAGELGLIAPGAFRIDALLSGDLSAFPAITNPLRELAVTFGPIGPRTVTLSAAPGNLNSAGTQLRAALSTADPAPAFTAVVVTVLGSRLLILPGTGGTSIQDYLAITLQSELPFQFSASSAVLLGNVALASHGEKVTEEVLGDGDAAVAFPKFELQKKPLSYIPSAKPGGTESTLRVLVNNVLWTEVPSLFGRGPADQVYTTRIADDGTVTVGFGDGRSGTRLPSGRANVVADYREGSGLNGRVRHGSLRTLLDLPVGLKSAVNPSDATGGADPEAIEQARGNAPTTVRTFGRAVSLRDFDNLVGSSGEVAKASATWVWNREARAVHLTIAAQGGQLFLPSDLARIQASLDTQRDPNHALFLDNYIRIPIVIGATVRVQSSYIASKIAEAAKGALLSALSFESLGFGQPLPLSDVYAALQLVEGVGSVDIDLFQFKNRSAEFLAARGATADPVQRSLRIFSARPNSIPSPPVLPAELAVVDTPAEDAHIITSGGLPD
jgi:hypothetical protein